MDVQNEVVAEPEMKQLPEPRIEELEEEWSALGCGCACDWSAD